MSSDSRVLAKNRNAYPRCPNGAPKRPSCYPSCTGVRSPLFLHLHEWQLTAMDRPKAVQATSHPERYAILLFSLLPAGYLLAEEELP